MHELLDPQASSSRRSDSMDTAWTAGWTVLGRFTTCHLDSLYHLLCHVLRRKKSSQRRAVQEGLSVCVQIVLFKGIE